MSTTLYIYILQLCMYELYFSVFMYDEKVYYLGDSPWSFTMALFFIGLKGPWDYEEVSLLPLARS